MTTTTPYFWDIEGTVLNTYAFNIATKGGNRFTPPPFRGENRVVPFVTGRPYLTKWRDSRVITLEMWVLALDEDGVAPTTPSGLEQNFNKNWDKVADAVAQDGQFSLTKRWKDGTTGSTRTATALAEYAGGMERDMTSPYRAEFTVDLLLADPWFYESTTPVRAGPLPEGESEITVPGSESTDRVFVTLGPDALITTQDGRWLHNVGDATIKVDCRERQSKRTSNGQIVNRFLDRSRSDPYFFLLKPGEQIITVQGVASLDLEPAHS